MKDYQKRAIENYQKKFDLINVRFPKGTKEDLQIFAENQNMTKNEVIVKAVLKYIRKEF